MDQKIKKEILINVLPHETRVAIIENSIFREVYFERENHRGIVGNIYKGKVIRVLPGMQAAFIDIGLDKAGFLHVSDIMPLSNEDTNLHEITTAKAHIRNWIREGQEILVQIMKDPIGSKGARLTTHISYASRFLVSIPSLNTIGISSRINSPEVRESIKEKIKVVLGSPNPQGYIVRTIAEFAGEECFKNDILFLSKLTDEVMTSSNSIKCPGLVYEDFRLHTRSLRDFADDNVTRILVDNGDVYGELKQFSEKYTSGVFKKLEFYNSKVPLFDTYDVEGLIDKALDRKVQLKSGGYLIFDQTEAMVTIDVNTGAYVGQINLEETIFKTNIEAAKEIASHLRLRNLGGIIVVDFIDMINDNHKLKVLTTLRELVEQDRSRTSISDFSKLGLVEISRKRITDSLLNYLCKPCSQCNGTGMIKSIQTVWYEIFRKIIRESKNTHASERFLVAASTQVIDYLLHDEKI